MSRSTRNRSPKRRNSIVGQFRNALEARGVLLAENYWCCIRCGNSAIDEYESFGYPYYAFYHSQDAESATQTGDLYFAFGPFENLNDSNYKLAGSLVVEAAEESGFHPIWDGDHETCVLISNFPRDHVRRLLERKESPVSVKISNPKKQRQQTKSSKFSPDRRGSRKSNK